MGLDLSLDLAEDWKAEGFIVFSSRLWKLLQILPTQKACEMLLDCPLLALLRTCLFLNFAQMHHGFTVDCMYRVDSVHA